MTEQEREALYSKTTARKMAARCIELIREQSEKYLDPDYCTDQPICSFAERFALDQMAFTLENEFALGTVEQCKLLGNPTPFERIRHIQVEGETAA